MKRLLFVLLISFLFCSFLFSHSAQKVYLMSDDVWQKTDILCRSNGVLGPTPISPITQSEIEVALSRLNYQSLSTTSKILYDEIVGLFQESAGFVYKDETVTIKPSIKVNPQFYLFNNY